MDAGSNFAKEVVRLTDGEGVHVAYDGTGPVSWKASLDALRRCGTLCWFGPILGGPGPVEITSIPKSIKIGYAVFAASTRWPTSPVPMPTWKAARRPVNSC